MSDKIVALNEQVCKFDQSVFEQQVRLDKYYMNALVYVGQYNADASAKWRDNLFKVA